MQRGQFNKTWDTRTTYLKPGLSMQKRNICNVWNCSIFFQGFLSIHLHFLEMVDKGNVERIILHSAFSGDLNYILKVCFMENQSSKICLPYFRSCSLLAQNFSKNENPTQVHPVDFSKFLRTPFLRNTSRRLLLSLPESFGFSDQQS